MNKVLFLTVHKIYRSELLYALQGFKLHFDKNYLNYLLFFMLWHIFISCKTDCADNHSHFTILN